MECWDVEVKAGHPFKLEVEQGRIIHITQAELCEQKEGEGSDLIPLFVEINGKTFVISSLSSKNIPQVNFDLVFEKDVVLSHGAKNGSIYFRGYSTANFFLVKERAGFGNCEAKPEEVKPSAASKGKSVKPESSTKEMQDASDDDDLSGSEDDEDEDSSEDEEEEAPKKVESSKKRSKESAEKTPVPTKKAKTVIPNKTGIQHHCMYKNWLQEYTEKASISLPRYTIGEIEGPQHIPMFSSIVLVDGEHYTSCSFGTQKAAEQDAARVALNAISDKFKNAGSPLLVHEQHCMYKNCLQEYTQKASISPPRYTIGKIEGLKHMPMFSSIVLVDGESYTSSCSFGTRKAAEQDAARVALNAISDKIKNAGCPFLVHKDMQDASDDDDLSGSEDDEDEDSSEDEEEETPKKVESSKKRSKESAEKTSVPTKKAKTVKPQKKGKESAEKTSVPTKKAKTVKPQKKGF